MTKLKIYEFWFTEGGGGADPPSMNPDPPSMRGENFGPKIAHIFVGPLGGLFGGVFGTFSDQKTEKTRGFPYFLVSQKTP